VSYCCRYATCELSELSLAMKMVKIASNIKDESLVLCSSDYKSSASINSMGCPEKSFETCLNLHYRTHKHDGQLHHLYQLKLNDVDLHVNPSVIGQIWGFLRNLESVHLVNSDVGSSTLNQSSLKSRAINDLLPKFALSNLCGADGTLFAGISVDHFPFLDTDSTCGHKFGCPGTPDVEALESMCSKIEMCQYHSGLNGSHASGLVGSSLCEAQHSDCSSSSSRNLENVSVTVLDLSLVSVRVHFPESCGILATITIPESIATLTLLDASSWDFLLSANNLTLASPWTPPNFHELLWDTSSHHNTNVLNARVKKDLPTLSTEVCVGVQNVCCILPSKLLAMFVGFFLLDDWDPILEQHHSVANNDLECYREPHVSITYKFELSDCVVIFPVEKQDFFCLKLDVPHFFCEFIPTGSSVEFVKRIPKDFSSDCTVSKETDIISISARNTSISLIFLSNQTNFFLKLDQNVPKGIHSLVEKLDAGIWIQIPCKEVSCSPQPSLPIFIMSKISKCNLVAEGTHHYYLDLLSIFLQYLNVTLASTFA
jgi:hypothetical protein